MSPNQSIVVSSRLPCISGLRVAMRVQGEGDPLLLINGMTRPLESWDPVTQELHGRKVITFDSPGVGGSRTPVRPLSMPELAGIAVAVLNAAGVDDADVLGYSHGGAVAQQLAFDVPDRVRTLILVATSCGVGATPGTSRAILRGIGGPVEGNTWPIPDPLGMLWQSLAVSSWSSIPFLGAIRAPTLVVCGSRDRVVPPSNGRVLARRIPGASLRMLPGGHDAQRGDSAKTLADVVEDFLSVGAAAERLRVCG